MADGIVEVQMPQMGESVTEGTILEWHVSEGEQVAEGDTVVEVSTDKIDAEVPAPASGVVTKLLANPDDTVEVGQALAQIDPNGAATAPSAGNGASADPSPLEETKGGLVMGGGEGDADLGDQTAGSEAPQPGVIEEPRPSAGPSAPEGETVVLAMPEMGDTVAEGSTDKIDAEVPAPASGTIAKLLVQPDDTVQVGQALAEIVAGQGA